MSGGHTPGIGTRIGTQAVVLTSPSTGCLPTLLAFAHSLAMRKPSVEAREKVRFLGTVVHPDLGTLDRQRS